MTRTGALVWKEGRDHRAAVIVFAAIVPLVSWPVQRYAFKFAEPAWTWSWLVPLCVGLAVAVVAADVFAMDLATSRMSAFAALPVPLRRHFAARVTFLGLVAAAIAAWTVAANVAIVGIWGKPDAVVRHLDAYDSGVLGLLMTAAGAGAVLVFSALGVGGFRAVFGGALLAFVGFVSTEFAFDKFLARPAYNSAPLSLTLLEWAVAAIVLFAAAYAGFVGGRAHAASRRRGAVFASSILVAAFGLPSGGAAWKAYRAWNFAPTDPDVQVSYPSVSPDGRYVAVAGMKYGVFGGSRTWIVRVADGKLFDWVGRREGVFGWSKDGEVWIGAMDGRRRPSDDLGRLARAETGDTIGAVARADLGTRVHYGSGFDSTWASWLGWNVGPSKTPATAPKGVSSWTLWAKDDEKTKLVIEARAMPAPMRTTGEVLIATPDARLAVVSFAGGAPRIVADDAVGLRGPLAGSRDGRFFLVTTSKGEAVFDSATWKPIAGPYAGMSVTWCNATDGPCVAAVFEQKEWRLVKLLDVSAGREIVPDPAVAIHGGYGSVQTLPDGRFVAHDQGGSIVLLDADGKLVRQLFPPKD